MRVQRISYGLNGKGKSGTIISHQNNLLVIRLDAGAEYEDFYWNYLPLDDEAKTYLAEVERTAIPMKTTLM
jgi:hypothetical protein